MTYIFVAGFCLGCILIHGISLLWVAWQIRNAPDEPYPGAWGPLE